MPKVSIVIPVFNAQDFIRETLESVMNQTFTDFECVIVNDGSTDSSLDIINSYVDIDQRFKVFTISNSGSANLPRNIAIDHSLGEFIFNIDADDIIEIDCLDKMLMKQIEKNVDIVLLTLIGCENNLRGELYRLPLKSFDQNHILNGREAFSMTIGGWLLTCAGMLVRKNVFFLFNERNIYINSDELFFRKTLFFSNKVAFADTKYYYRNNLNSITKMFSNKLFERLLVDKQLEDFVCEQFDVHSIEAKKIRNTRLFNYIQLQYNYFEFIKTFSKDNRKKIKNILSSNYHTLNIACLRNELPLHLKIFLISYDVFKLYSILYVFLKQKRGKQYIFK